MQPESRRPGASQGQDTADDAARLRLEGGLPPDGLAGVLSGLAAAFDAAARQLRAIAASAEATAAIVAEVRNQAAELIRRQQQAFPVLPGRGLDLRLDPPEDAPAPEPPRGPSGAMTSSPNARRMSVCVSSTSLKPRSPRAISRSRSSAISASPRTACDRATMRRAINPANHARRHMPEWTSRTAERNDRPCPAPLPAGPDDPLGFWHGLGIGVAASALLWPALFLLFRGTLRLLGGAP